MFKRLVVVAALVGFPVALAAQDAVEIGVAGGLQINMIDAGETFTVTQFGIPGSGASSGGASVYLSIFASPQIIIEPQLGISYTKPEGDDAIWSFAFAPQLAYLFSPGANGSAYAGVNVALDYLGAAGESASQFGLGAALGYRLRVQDRLGLRFEGRFRRFFENDDFFAVNEISFLVGIGAIIPKG